MPIADVVLTDTFDQWRQKTNVAIDIINNLGASAAALAVSDATNGQILVFDGTFFRNVTVSGDIAMDNTGNMTVVGGTGFSKGRLYFGASMRGLY